MKRVVVMFIALVLVLNANAQTECLNPQDANQDGLIGVEDLMDLLSHWGDTDLDFDGVYDSVDLCTDDEACNYVFNPTEPCKYLDVLGVCGGGNLCECISNSRIRFLVFCSPTRGAQFEGRKSEKCAGGGTESQ